VTEVLNSTKFTDITAAHHE